MPTEKGVSSPPNPKGRRRGVRANAKAALWDNQVLDLGRSSIESHLCKGRYRWRQDERNNGIGL
jgi:hypothetical protein